MYHGDSCFLFLPKLPLINKSFYIMGKGDNKTKKGKIINGSFGKSRPARPTQTKKAETKKPA